MAPPVLVPGRCTEKGCPYRWTDGVDRACATHATAEERRTLDAAIMGAPDGVTVRARPPDTAGRREAASR